MQESPPACITQGGAFNVWECRTNKLVQESEFRDFLPSPSSDEEFVDLEKEFEQNELNSAVYLISIAMQISNFAVNYKVSNMCTQ